jgi:pilus assembly protein CpaC
MPSGGSMVMAGLIQQRTRQAMEGLPGAKDIPVLGALFRSRDYQNDETELVVIVTPYLVSPTKLANLRTPGDGFAPATDMESLILGRINRQYKAPGADTTGKGWRGPFGHVVN